MGERERVFFGTGYVFATTVAGIVTSVILRLLLVQVLGIADYGVLALAISLMSLFSLVADLGFSSALPKFVAEQQDATLRRRHITASVVSSAVIGAAAFLVLVAVSPAFVISFGMPALPVVLAIFGIQLPFSLASLAFLGAINGSREMRLYSVVVLFMHLSGLILIGLALAIGGGLVGAAIAISASSVIHFSLLLYLCRAHLSWNGWQTFWADARSLLRFGIKMSATNWASTILYQIDIVLLAFFSKSDLVVGYYSIAMFLARVLWIVPGSLSVVAYPAISEYWTSGARSRIGGFVNRGLRFSAGLVGLGVVALVYFGPEVLSTLFGSQALPAFVPLVTLLLGMAMLGTMKSVATGISSVGRPDLGLLISLAGLGSSVVLNLLLIPQMGIVGAALGTSLAYAFVSVLLFHFVGTALKVPLDRTWFLKASALVGILAAPGVFLATTGVAPDWARWSIGLLSWVFLGLVLYARLLAREDTAFVISRLKEAIRGPLPP